MASISRDIHIEADDRVKFRSIGSGTTLAGRYACFDVEGSRESVRLFFDSLEHAEEIANSILREIAKHKKEAAA